MLLRFLSGVCVLFIDITRGQITPLTIIINISFFLQFILNYFVSDNNPFVISPRERALRAFVALTTFGFGGTTLMLTILDPARRTTQSLIISVPQMLFQLPACVNATATICAPSPDSNLGRCNI
jgi:hypothetical protein